MPAVNLSPIFQDAQLDASGNPNSGGKLFTYTAGSSTKAATYTTSAGSVAQANPIVLNARGEPDSPIWLTDGVSYKFVYTNSGDSDPPASPIRTIDNVLGVNDVAAAAQSEWIAYGSAPTYTAAATFTLVGDQTTVFHVGRRLKCTVTAGTVYVTIAKSAFTSVTTVTVDPASLDSGLSAVSYGINSAANTSLPINDSQLLSWNGPIAPHEGLVVTRPSAATLTLAADKLVVTDTNGRKAVLTSVSVTPSLAASGANGLDTGAEAASTWYHAWVIWNGTTKAGLLSLSATAPTMPSGYTHKAYVGADYNDGSSNLIIIMQRGIVVRRIPLVLLAGDTNTTRTQVAITASVPPNAKAVDFQLSLNGTTAGQFWCTLAPSNSTDFEIVPALTRNPAGNVGSGCTVSMPLLSTPAIWHSVSSANIALFLDAIGWRF